MEKTSKPRARLPTLGSPMKKPSQTTPSPLAPFEHLESLAERSEIVDFQQLCKTLAKPQPAGYTLCFRVQTKDSVFAEKTVGGDRWTVIARGLTMEATVDGTVTDLGTGQYDVMVQVTKSGRYQIDLLLSKRIVSSLISNSVSSQLVPPTALILDIEAGPICASQSLLVFDGMKAKAFEVAPIAGRDGYFLVKARDQYGNPTFLGNQESLKVSCKDPNFRILGQDKFDGGVYKVSYYTQVAGIYAVEAYLTSPKCNAPTAFAGSPVTVLVLPDQPAPHRCLHDEVSDYHAGDRGQFQLQLFDQYGNPIDNAQIEVDANAPEVSCDGVRNLKAEGHPGHYTLAFRTHKCFAFVINVTVVGNAHIPYAAPVPLLSYEILPSPGRMTVTSCFQVQQLRGTAGISGTINIHKKDEFGNAVPISDNSLFQIVCDDQELNIDPAVSDNTDTCSVGYFTTKAKTYVLTLMFDGSVVEGGPGTLVIEPDVPNPENSFLELPIAYGWAGEPTTIWAVLQDMYGNLSSKVDTVPVTVQLSDDDPPQLMALAPNQRFEARVTGVAVTLTSNISQTDLPLHRLLNNDVPADSAAVPIISFNVPPPPYIKPDPLILHALNPEDSNVLVFAPTHSWLQLTCKQRAVSFVQCRLLSQSGQQDSSLWYIEYSDNGTQWVETARLLQRNGWAEAHWPYCGDHLFWRLSCPNLHANSDTIAADIDPVPPGVVRCPCPFRHRKPQPSAWLSLEWYVPATGHVHATITKHETKVYNVTMHIADSLVAQCIDTSFPLWINNSPSAAHSSIHFADPHQLFVSRTVSFIVRLKDKFGHQRLVGSAQEMKMIDIRILDPQRGAKPVELTNNQDGTYTVTFDGYMAGVYSLEVKFSNETIPAPSKFTLLPGHPDSAKCVALPIDPNYEEIKRLGAQVQELRASYATIQSQKLGLEIPHCSAPEKDPADVEHAELDLDRKYANGLEGGVVGRTFRFRLLARDEFFNHCTVPCPDLFNVTIRPDCLLRGSLLQDGVEPILAEVKYEKDGYYGVWYTVSRAGSYSMEICLQGDVEKISMMTVPLTMNPAAVCPSECHLIMGDSDNYSPPQQRSGRPLPIVICLRDMYNNPLIHDTTTPLSAVFECPWDNAPTSNLPLSETDSPRGLREPVDPLNVWEPVCKPPEYTVSAVEHPEDGVYQVTCIPYTAGYYTVRLMYTGVDIYTCNFEVVPGEIVPANCLVISTSSDVRHCLECELKTAIYSCRKCAQAYCDRCWRVRHENPHRVGHRRALVGVDDKARKVKDDVNFAILARDGTGNVVLMPDNPELQMEIFMEFREYQPEPKPRKEVKSKKKSIALSFLVRHLEGHVTSMEVASTDLVVTLKRRISEQEKLPSNVQKLVLDGQVMEDGKAIGDYRLSKGSIVEVQLCDINDDQRFRVQCQESGQGLWHAQFPVIGHGHYTVGLTVGEVSVPGIHHFAIDMPAEESKGKASQMKELEALQKELDDLRGRWNSMGPTCAGIDDGERAA